MASSTKTVGIGIGIVADSRGCGLCFLQRAARQQQIIRITPMTPNATARTPAVEMPC